MNGELEPGTILFNKYRLDNVIGKGGFGSVYKAVDIRLGRAVAIKTLLYGQSSLDHRFGTGTFYKYLDRFKREATVSSYFTENPHIVTVYGLEEDEAGNFYLIMEYLPGGSLVDLMRQHGRLSVERACAIVLDICNALAEVHDHPADIVHRDIKPANVLLRANGKAVLTDFGVAQVGHESHRTTDEATGNRHPGSPPYMSPEQASRFDYLTPPSDLYSLGMVFYEIVTSRLYAKTKILPPSKLNELIPEWLDRIFIKMLQRDPEDRYQRAGEIAAAIRSGLEEQQNKEADTTPLYAAGHRPADEVKPKHQEDAEWRQRQAEAALRAQLEREAEEERRQIAEAALKASPPAAALVETEKPQNVEDLSAQLVVAIYLSDWDEVIALGERILRLDPRHEATLTKTAAAYKSRGVAFLVKGEYDRAIADLTRSVKLDPSRADYFAELASAFHNKGDYENAISNFKTAIKLDRNNAEYYLLLGNACHSRGDYESAIGNYEQAIKFNPNRADYYWQRGNSYYDKGDYKRAVSDFGNAITLEPTMGQYYYSRGLAYRARDNRKAAQRDFQQAIELGFTKAKVELLKL
jgi:serine/threonine protein kinase